MIQAERSASREAGHHPVPLPAIRRGPLYLGRRSIVVPGGPGRKCSRRYIPGAPEQQESVAQYLKSQLKKAGIDIEVRASPDFPIWAKRISNYDFDLSMDEVYNWGDPAIGVHRTYLFSNIRKGVIWSNTQQYSNPKVDDLLNKAAVEMDLAKRKALYDEFQMIVGDDLPIYWINALPYHSAYDKRIADFPESIWGTMQSINDTYWTRA
jgi:peptide/nickel transport system substrate-binding protein